MADTTALKNRIRAAIKANDNQEITGPVLQQALLDMVDELNGATETEASQRQNGDSTLQQNINTEAQQRQNGDSTLQQGINTERQARIDADNALGQRITEEIQQEHQRAEDAFDDLDIIDAAGSQVAPNAIDLTLRKNDGSEEDPEWRTLCHLLIPSVSIEKAGLMSVAMRNLLYNLRDAGYAFGGIAVPNTNPGVPTANCFYIVRGAGTYTHFKNADNESIVLENDGIYVLTYESVENNYWEWNLIVRIDDVPTAESNNLIKSSGVDRVINGSTVIDRTSFESNKWYTHTAVGEPLTLNTSYGYTYAYKGIIPQDTFSIDVLGKGSTGACLWYTLDANENVVRLSGSNMTSDHIVLQDGEIYIVVQTNNIGTNPGKIIFCSNTGINPKIERLQNLINNKLIKLAKWGPTGNPTDLHVGDIYTLNGSQLIQVDAIINGVVTNYHNIPFIDGAIYTLYDELYIYNGTCLQKDNRVITLTGIGTVGNNTSGITATGQFYYNTVTNKIYRCTHYNTTPQDSTFEDMTVLANTDTLYLCKGSIYYYDGTNMVSLIGNNIPIGDKLTVDDDGKPRNVSVDENYGLQVGYMWDGYYNNNLTRVSTKLLNALTKDVKIKVASDNFEIRGYTLFDANYNRIEYVSILANRKVVTLTKGYYYSVVFSKIDTSSSITPDEIAPYIWIDDRIKLNELVNNVSPFIDIQLNVVSLAETNAWYMGSVIGSTITKISYINCYAVKYPVTQNQVYELSAKGGITGRGWYLLDSEDKIIDLAPTYFNDTVTLTIPEGVSYLIVQSNAGLDYLALSILGKVRILEIKTNELQEDVEQLQEDVEQLQEDVQKDTFKCKTSFLWNKLSRMKNLATGFCNIGFIGDSWTQGTQDNIVSGKFEGYVKPLTKMLQDEYGFGGLGWLDFARDGGNGTMFGCAEMYEHWNYSFTGTVTGLDGHNDQQAPDCLGICCAHIIFANAATLTLTFDAGYLDKFKLRYYKDAHFSVSINGGTAVEITANSTDGWQETEFGTTGTDTTSIVITSLADNTIIFGMDCFYGTKGVRVHKIGNRSIAASDYLLMNAAQWEEGIAKLELCWASVLLAINDLGSSDADSRINQITTNVYNLLERVKVATDDGNGLVTCDLNVLGVENIEASGWIGLGKLAKKQKAMALTNGYGWCSTDKCIGSKKAEFTYNGTFSDTIHLNKIGSYAYAKHIYNSLFEF